MFEKEHPEIKCLLQITYWRKFQERSNVIILRINDYKRSL